MSWADRVEQVLLLIDEVVGGRAARGGGDAACAPLPAAGPASVPRDGGRSPWAS